MSSNTRLHFYSAQLGTTIEFLEVITRRARELRAEVERLLSLPALETPELLAAVERACSGIDAFNLENPDIFVRACKGYADRVVEFVKGATKQCVADAAANRISPEEAKIVCRELDEVLDSAESAINELKKFSDRPQVNT